MIPNNKADFKTKKIVYKKNSMVYFFYQIVIRMSVFLFLILSGILMLYFVGNYQDFLDSTQKLILNLTAILSVTTALFLFLGFILNFVTFFTLRRKVTHLVIYSVIYFFMLVVSVVTFVLSRSVLLLSNGL